MKRFRLKPAGYHVQTFDIHPIVSSLQTVHYSLQTLQNILLLQASNHVFYKRRRYGSQQETWKYKDDHTGGEGCNDKEIVAYGDNQYSGNHQDNILAKHRNGRDPNSCDQQSPVKNSVR